MLLFLFGDWVMLMIECLNTASAAFHYVAMPPKPFSFLISYPGLTFALDENIETNCSLSMRRLLSESGFL